MAQSKKLNPKLVHPAKAKSKAEVSPKKASGPGKRKPAKSGPPSRPSPVQAVSSKLKPKEEMYVEYLIQGYCQSDAARLAGFDQSDNALYVTASRLLRKAKVQERLAQRIAEAQINTDEILGTLHEHLHASYEDFLDFDEMGRPFYNLKRAAEMGLLHLVKEINFGPLGGVNIKLHDAHAAAVQLSRIKGLDKSQQQGNTLTINQIRVILKKKKVA